ncbi:hypothetical protein LCM00_13605 [Bacillus infantis]|uniref:hypothetical protein n=1 Tax=Bacillus infantis TaxID=324767 RepID=UPI001CD440D3|nr:hypothetical protein [Bacillus infantis]MCA1040544.1 hypothetical protein [Bacillus infantis]
MAKYTILELRASLSLEDILEVLRRKGKVELTPSDENWPSQERIYASMLPFENQFTIKEIDTKITIPEKIEIDKIKEKYTVELTPEIIEKKERVIFSYVEIQRPKTDWYDNQDRLLSLDKRINLFESDSLFFEEDDTCYVAIQGAPKSDKVLRTKRDILHANNLLEWPKSVKSELVGIPQNFVLDSDFFYWLYYLHKEKNGRIESLSHSIFILELSGFHGTSLSETQRTKSQGDRITQLLTTNAFIFGKDDLKALRLTLQYGNEIVELELHYDGSVDLLSYDGEFANGTTLRSQAQLILIYKILLPFIQEVYQSQKKSGQWSQTVLELFLHKIGNEMITSITNQVNKLIAKHKVTPTPDSES